MKTMYTSFLVGNRVKWMLMGLALAVVLLFPHQDATAGLVAPVNLGSAGSFGALAGTKIGSANGGKIHGDVGVWQGTVFVPGVPPVIVTGTVHLDDLFCAAFWTSGMLGGFQTPATGGCIQSCKRMKSDSRVVSAVSSPHQ